MTSNVIDALEFGMIWRRLDGIMDEVAEAFIRTAFSSIVRENSDFAFALLDSGGRQFAQWSRSIPSFIGIMPVTLAAMLEKIPRESIGPGDVLISNDPWIGAGHLNDITMIKPIFTGDVIAAFVGSTFHSVDIGGARSPHAAQIYAEGLRIPIAKAFVRGVENADVMAFIRENVRAPESTLRDMRAQVGAYGLAERKIAALMDEHEQSLDAIAAEILQRSERSIRAQIARVPSGVYASELKTDGYDSPITIRTQVTVEGDRISIDYAGSSPQLDRPINSVLNYTRAYTVYAIKSALDPNAPNNQGSFLPISVTAPEGSILNPRPPAPVWARSLTGHYLPTAIFMALSEIIPDHVIAQGGANWNIYFRGQLDDRRMFIKNYFMNGGHGARPHMDGPGCLSFPSNIANEPVERFETSAPLLIREKTFVPDTSGAGRFRGGPAQRVTFESRSAEPIVTTIRIERVKFPPLGLAGGLPGSPGQAVFNGRPVAPKSEVLLKRGESITFQTPGGGGMGPPRKRDSAAVRADVENGLITCEAARTVYGACEEKERP